MNQQLATYVPTLLTVIAVALGVIYNSHHLDSRIAALDSRIADLKSYVDKRIDDLRDLMKAEIAPLRADIARIDQRLDRLETQRIVR